MEGIDERREGRDEEENGDGRPSLGGPPWDMSAGRCNSVHFTRNANTHYRQGL